LEKGNGERERCEREGGATRKKNCQRRRIYETRLRGERGWKERSVAELVDG